MFGRALIVFFRKMRIKNLRGVSEVRFIKLDSFTGNVEKPRHPQLFAQRAPGFKIFMLKMFVKNKNCTKEIRQVKVLQTGTFPNCTPPRAKIPELPARLCFKNFEKNFRVKF